MAERIVIVGAGMAGLCSALALAGADREITLLDRDPPPPEGGPEAAFEHWARRGVGHLRHSHGFLARFRNLIRDEHPALLEALAAAGARDFGFEESLSPTLRAAYRADAGDDDLALILSRRTTVELVMRRFVEGLPGVTLKTEIFVRSLALGRTEVGETIARGVTLQDGSTLAADIVIDASGLGSGVVDQLNEAGATIAEEVEDCAILYYTRFYRLLPGAEEPPRGVIPGTGDLGFLKFGVFATDAGTFSVTLAVPEVEETLRTAVVKPEVFEAICAELPGVAQWLASDRAQATTRVFGMGKLQSRWREMAPAGRPAALGLYAVGDSLVRTNPLYGRGCSFAMVEAHLLRDVLAQTPDPAERARRYSRRVRTQLRAFYDDMVDQDRNAARRARQALDPAYKPSRRSRLARSFFEDGLAVAIRTDVTLLRSALRAFHMLEPPRAWATRPATVAKAVAAWARGKRANAAHYPPKPGPDRDDLFARIGLAAETDVERLRAA